MDKLYALLVDDDKLNCESLQYLLEHDCNGIEVIGMAYNAAEARKFLSENTKQPDVVFLDINMPGETGFKFLESLSERNFDVVFATAYDDYGVQALKVSAVDYLIKPISIDDLQVAVEKLKTKRNKSHHTSEQKELIENLLHNIQNTSQTKIALPHVSGIKFVELNEITHLEADSNYTIVHLNNLQKVVVSRSLKEFEDLLSPTQFMRVHKSNIINLNYVKEYSGVHGGELILADGNSVSISKTYYDDFIKQMKQVSLSFKKHA